MTDDHSVKRDQPAGRGMRPRAWVTMRALGLLSVVGLIASAGCRDAREARRAPGRPVDDGVSAHPDGATEPPIGPRLLWSKADDGLALEAELGAAAFGSEVALLVSSKGTRAVRPSDGALLWQSTAELLHPVGVLHPLFEVHRDTDPVTLVALAP